MAGSIEKRRKSYRLIVSDGYNFEEKQIRYTKTMHRTKKEAEIELAKLVSEIPNGLVNVHFPVFIFKPSLFAFFTNSHTTFQSFHLPRKTLYVHHRTFLPLL